MLSFPKSREFQPRSTSLIRELPAIARYEGQKDDAGEKHTEYRLEEYREKYRSGRLYGAAYKSYHKIDNSENKHSYEEEIVYHSADRYRYRENAPFVFGYEHFESKKQKGEENYSLVEMVKEDIIDRKTRKRVKERAELCGIVVAGKPSYKKEGGKGGAGEF